MKALMNKLRTSSGETLVESLASILIFTLASLVMFSMVTVALRVNTAVKQWDLENQRQVNAAERADIPTGSGTVTIRLEGSPIADVAVDVCGGVDEAGVWQEEILYSFFVSGEPGGDGA